MIPSSPGTAAIASAFSIPRRLSRMMSVADPAALAAPTIAAPARRSRRAGRARRRRQVEDVSQVGVVVRGRTDDNRGRHVLERVDAGAHRVWRVLAVLAVDAHEVEPARAQHRSNGWVGDHHQRRVERPRRVEALGEVHAAFLPTAQSAFVSWRMRLDLVPEGLTQGSDPEFVIARS
jgi:hypothetical protein